MAIPPNTTVLDFEMDPRDRTHFTVGFRGEEEPLLEAGEEIVTFTVTPSADSVAKGMLPFDTTGDYATAKVLSNTGLKLFPQIDEDFHLDPDFDGSGLLLTAEVFMVTNTIPPHEYERTIGFKVAQQ